MADDDVYSMPNLRPADTGLPMMVWVGSARGRVGNDVWVKVQRAPGSMLDGQFTNTVTVAVRPQPHLEPPGQPNPLSASDLDAVYRWCALNEETLVAYGEGSIDEHEMIRRVQPLMPPVT